MGAIAGIFHPGTPKPVDPARIVAMTTAQAHRGPDGSGVWTAPGIGLGHRRLAILDIAGGHQPMRSADGTLSLSYDGEIYNFEALRDDLRALGAVFATQGDTEVILHAWSAWGPAMLDRLDGMFAIALHDARRQCLFLARDRLGVKPLHYTELSDGGIAFASELKGLLAHPLVRRSPDIRAIEDYLAFGYVPDDACLVAGVRKLPAGSMLSIHRGRPVPPPSRWWDIDFSRQETGKTKTFAEELTGLLRDAVRTRMVADVPLGAALSGDGGSAAVVALMAEASKRAVSTCALGTSLMAGGDPDSIEQIARRFATDHRSGGDAVGESEPLDRLVAMFDEPFADPAAIGHLRLCELARDRIRVMLCGDGALEVLGGHPGYGIYHTQERVRAIIPKSIWTGPLGGIARKSGWKTLVALAEDGPSAYAHSVSMTAPALRAQLFSEAGRRALGGHRAEDRYSETIREAPAGGAFERAQYADLRYRLPGQILTMADRIGMSMGLETRSPLLDHRLVEFTARLPASMRRRGEGRWLMRQAMERYLPDDISKPGKTDIRARSVARFPAPPADRVSDLARSRILAGSGWFEPAILAHIAADHLAGRAEYRGILWQLVMLDRSLARLFG